MTVIGDVECSASSSGSRNVQRLRRVVLRVWGFAAIDVRGAEANARQSPYARDSHITKVVRSSGPPCPIPLHDASALEQSAEYDGAWAVYPDWSSGR
jgi:hypothetical protein